MGTVRCGVGGEGLAHSHRLQLAQDIGDVLVVDLEQLQEHGADGAVWRRLGRKGEQTLTAALDNPDGDALYRNQMARADERAAQRRAAGHATPDALQHLLSRARWNPDDIRDDLQTYVAEHPGRPNGVLIIDDTGFLKKGTTSAGVQRQYSGTAGRTENCQIGVFAAYASAAGRALVDRELYLPKSWTDDRDRCRAAKVPDQREFATKNTLAATIVRRVLASPLPIAWVTADAAYGQDNRFRRMQEASGVGYVLAVPKSQFSLAGPRIDRAFEQAPEQAWERRSCGAGAKGQREYDWAAVQLRPVAEYDHQDGVLIRRRWALARRSLSRPDEIAYYLGYAPLDVGVDELVRVAGIRWAIEECFQAAKNECGLDEYEVRRYVGWYRHITLAMLAHTFLAAMSARAAEKGDPPVRLPWSSSSPWRKCGASWQLTHPETFAPAPMR